MSKIIFFINVWRKIVFDIYFTEFGTSFLQLFYLFFSSIVINTVILTAEPLSRNVIFTELCMKEDPFPPV
jgi:hypothetical protein